jgi:polar amino acid transport system permease protein
MFDWSFTLEILPLLTRAAVVTIEATLAGFALAAPFGLMLAILRMVPGPYVAPAVIAIIEFIRSTPALIQIYYLYFVILPVLHMTPSAFTAGVFALGIHYATYCSEVYRSGLENIPRGQWEASIALNLSTYRTFRDIILPQAIPPVVPALGNYLVALFKETPLMASISALELMSVAKSIGSDTFRYNEPITLVGLFFLAMSLVAAAFVRLVEYRLSMRHR